MDLTQWPCWKASNEKEKLVESDDRKLNYKKLM